MLAIEKPLEGNTEGIELRLDAIIARLVWCESRGNPKAINKHDPITASIGLLQFKESTFKAYSKLYSFTGDIKNGEDQKELAKIMIKDNRYAVYNWLNCYNKIKGRDNRFNINTWKYYSERLYP